MATLLGKSWSSCSLCELLHLMFCVVIPFPPDVEKLGKTNYVDKRVESTIDCRKAQRKPLCKCEKT